MSMLQHIKVFTSPCVHSSMFNDSMIHDSTLARAVIVACFCFVLYCLFLFALACIYPEDGDTRFRRESRRTLLQMLYAYANRVTPYTHPHRPNHINTVWRTCHNNNNNSDNHHPKITDVEQTAVYFGDGFERDDV